MKRQILGLDINDEYVAAVVVGLRGQDKVITGSGFARFDDPDNLAEVLPSLLEHVGWQKGTCIYGVSLSAISLRNLTIPFTEKRKIAQILPLELEDQLIRPVHDQIVEYSITGADENQSHLLVASLEKDRLRHDLDLLKGTGLSPEVVTLRSVALAEQFLRGSDLAGGFLLVDADLHAVTIVVASDGQVVFARRLAYPDRVFTERPFIFDDDGLRIAHHDEAMECIGSLCNSIKRSTWLYQLESGAGSLPEKIVLSGGMTQVAAFREKLESEFGQAVHIGDLQQQLDVTLDDDVRDGWNLIFAEHALALALQGFRRKITFNFCKNEFARPRLFASKPQLLAASALFVFFLAGIFAYLGYDYRALNARHAELGDRMVGLFKETFPETTRIVDPLVQMKTKLRDIQAPSIATPIFSGDKRALNILADISGRVPGSVEIHVSRLVIDKESVVIKGTTDTFNNVNLIQGVLRKSSAYNDVDIVSASAEKDSELIRFELKLRTAGAS
jgi:general secretion pathway protein L